MQYLPSSYIRPTPATCPSTRRSRVTISCFGSTSLTSSDHLRAGREPIRVRRELVAAGGRAEEPSQPVVDAVRGRCVALDSHPADRIRGHVAHRAEAAVL